MFELLHADCRAVLANMADNSVDSIVTDPPYHLTSIAKRFGPGQAPAQFGTDGAFARASRGFMGQTWDGGDIAFDPELWAECLRVLKPGGHLLAFSGTRTYHRMAYAIDLAGFEIRDMLSWLYGSGFPKSHDIALAIDKAAGVEREVTGTHALPGYAKANVDQGAQNRETLSFAKRSAEPVTAEAQEWQGYGTALKPACEPICMARKPLAASSVAANALAWGTGPINIDGCRVPGVKGVPASLSTAGLLGWGTGGDLDKKSKQNGRFPANVLHDGSAELLALFPQTTSGKKMGGSYERATGVHEGGQRTDGTACYADSGSAARFFYCAKASKADREIGCENLPAANSGVRNGSGRHITRGYDEDIATGRRNIHPTVKPTDLMRWLVRLVTRPGGVVFDPFTGSGSTGRGAILEGCRFIGAEMTPEYIPIARARIDAAVNGR